MTEFEKIYRDYFDDVFLYIKRLSGSEDIAEDITSEAFYKAMRSIKGFRGECDIRVWLCQIAKNCYYTYLKKSARIEGNAEEQILKRDEAMRARKILRSIPDPYREVFMWRVFAQLSYKQIGELFGKTENWACVTYHRARGMIRTGLEENENEK